MKRNRSTRNICTSAGRVTSALLLSFLAVAPFSTAATPQAVHAVQQIPFIPPVQIPEDSPNPLPNVQSRELEFTLRHVFHRGTYLHPQLHRRLDVKKDTPLWVAGETGDEKERAPRLRVRSKAETIQRLVDRKPSTIDSLLDAGRFHGQGVSLPSSAWTVEQVAGPNVTDKETVLSFARMAADAYVLEPHTGEWQDVGGGFNYTDDFGWESDGLRGHVFADTKNSTVVIGVKGTSLAVFDGSGTTTNDKINDNLFFSCCCGQGGPWLWHSVCDCQTSTYTCNSTCLVKALREKNRYYYAAQDLYRNATALYPNADIWLTGHSLGGSVSSLLALTVGQPVVTFQAVGEAMPAARLGLPTPPGYHVGSHQQRAFTGGYHFGHTADPIFMGVCNAATSPCTLGGYAMQSQCHTGQRCVYDTVADYGWRVGLGYHRILSVIRDVLEKYNDTAICEPWVNCTDCSLWKYYESNSSDTTTSSTMTKTTTRTKTRTETCKTPGWWGCLDETTTSKPITTTSSTSTSTSTCKTPGWFGGCLDPTTTSSSSHSSTTSNSAKPGPSITTTSTPTSSVSTTTSCKHPGFFGGCKDPTMTTTRTVPHTASRTSSTSPSPTTCTSKEWFGLICVDPSPDVTSSSKHPSKTGKPRDGDVRCVKRSWYGRCKEWSSDENRWKDEM